MPPVCRLPVPDDGRVWTTEIRSAGRAVNGGAVGAVNRIAYQKFGSRGAWPDGAGQLTLMPSEIFPPRLAPLKRAMNTVRITFTIAALAAGASGEPSPRPTPTFACYKALAAPRAPAGGAATGAQVETERRQQIALFVAAAEKAKDFHEKNPAHPNAADARNIQADSLLRAARAGARTRSECAARRPRLSIQQGKFVAGPL